MGQYCVKFWKSCFCCDYCPSVRMTSTSGCTRNVYGLLYSLCGVLCILANLIPGLMRSMPFCKDTYSMACRKYAGHLAIYRLSFSFAFFFLFMFCWTMCITSSRNTRSVLHNGFWFFKLLTIGLIALASAYISPGWFDLIIMYVGLVFVFTLNILTMIVYMTLIQNLGVICSVSCWKNVIMKYVLTFLMFFLFVAGITIAVFLYILYSSCTFNLVVITINLVLSYIINITSIACKIKKKKRFAILRGSVLSTMVMLMTWSAITNNPSDQCNPPEKISELSFFICNYMCLFLVGFAGMLATEFLFAVEKREFPNAIVYVEERGKEICGVWGKRKIVQTIEPPNPGAPPFSVVFSTTDEDDDEYESIVYKWFAMHDILMELTLYMMFCLTANYYFALDDEFHTRTYYNVPAMWFKLFSTWTSIVIFVFLDCFLDQKRGRTAQM